MTFSFILIIFYFFFRFQTIDLNIIASNFPPYIICANDSQAFLSDVLSPPLTTLSKPNISGIIFDILKKALWKLQPLALTGSIICNNTINIQQMGTFDSSKSYLFLGNFHYKSGYTQLGLIPTQTFLTTGLKRIVRKENIVIWPFLTPLSYDIGVIFTVIGVIVAGFIWLFEEKKWKKPIKSHLESMSEIILEVFGSIFIGNQLFFRSWASRMLLWSFWLIILFFLMIYAMQLFVNMMNYYHFYEDPIDFSDKTFGALDSELLIYGNLQNVQLYNDYETMFSDLLINRSLDVVLADWVVVSQYNNLFQDQLKVLPGFYQESCFIGLFFGNYMDFNQNFSASLMKYQKTIDFKRSFKDFMSGNSLNSSGNSFVNYNVTDENLLGVWIILLFLIILMVFLYITKKLKLFPLNFFSKKKNFHLSEENTEINKKIETSFQETFSNSIESTFL